MQDTVIKSELRFRKKAEATVVPALAHAQISASSEGLGWKGLYLEVGNNFGCEVDELMVDGHFVGLQLNDESIRIRTRSSGVWAETLMPSRTLWLHPEGTPFSVRHSLRSYWAGAVIDGHFLDSVLGCHYELRPCYVVQDDVLSHLLFALIDLLKHRHRSEADDPAIAAALIRSFVLTLGKRHGEPAAAMPANSGLAPHQLKALMAWVERHLSGSLTVEAMADRVGLSAAHFSREFKRATGSTPWARVMELRLEAAHAQLRQGQSPAVVAHDCGFADQSHLSRAMKARYGISPGEVVTQHKS